MTSGKSHPISLSGLKKLLKELPPPSVHDFDQLRIAAPELPELDKPLLVFVLPPSSYDSNFLTAQTYKDGGVRQILYLPTSCHLDACLSYGIHGPLPL